MLTMSAEGIAQPRQGMQLPLRKASQCPRIVRLVIWVSTKQRLWGRRAIHTFFDLAAAHPVDGDGRLCVSEGGAQG